MLAHDGRRQEGLRAVGTLDARVFHVRVTGFDVLQQVGRALRDLRAKLAGGVVQPAITVLVVPVIDVFALCAEGDVAGTAPERVFALVDSIGVLPKLGRGLKADFLLAHFTLEWPLIGMTAHHVSSQR